MSDEGRGGADDWDVHWQRYAESATFNPAQRMRHDLISELLLEDAQDRDMRLFDFGCGQGDFLQRLEQRFPHAELAGLELSERGIAISRRKVSRAKLIAADIFNPPPALERFAGWATHGLCSEVLEHLDQPSAFLELARKYLTDNARLIVTVPGGPISAFDRQIGHRQHFDRGAIRVILERAGYTVERTFLAGFPFFNLYRLLVIARGGKLANDIKSGPGGPPARLALIAMKLFRALFHANLRDSPFGWQVVAVARKASG